MFPDSVLAAFAPYSSSGGAWGTDGLLYVTGHDRPELYTLRLPPAGSTLLHIATVPIATAGQAIAFDPGNSQELWSIDRSNRQIVVTRLAEKPAEDGVGGEGAIRSRQDQSAPS